MLKRKVVRATGGVVVSTAIVAGGVEVQHSEGIVVSTAIAAGGIEQQHSEGIVGAAPVVGALDAQAAAPPCR